MPERRVVHAEVHGLAGRAAELRALVDALAAATREEEGCSAFRVYVLDAPGELLLVSEYAGEDALRAHYRTPHYGRYRASVDELLAGPSDVRIHHVTETVHAIDPNLPDPGLLG